MDATDGKAATRPFARLLIVLYALALVVLLVLTAPRHGPWFDEFWTRFFSDPAILLKDAFFDRWVEDVHPPLFSFLAWLSSGVTRLTIEHARLLNLIPLTFAAGYLATISRLLPRERAFIATLAISVSASPFFVDYFSEFRSYFSSICFFVTLTVTLVAQARLKADDRRAASIALWLGYGTSLAVCLNIHYLTTVMTVMLVAVFGLKAVSVGDWRRFSAYLASGIVLCLPFVAFVAYQWATIERISADYWLKTGVGAALWMMIQAVLVPISGARIAVAVAWLAAAIFYLRHGTPHRDRGTVAALLFAIIAEIIVLLVYTKMTAAMTGRYLMPLTVLSTALFSIFLGPEIFRRPWLAALFVAANLLAAVLAAAPLWSDMRWDEAARFLQQKQSACPGARIVPMQQDPNDHTPNSIANYNQAYGYMARKWGLTLGPVDTSSSRPRDPACPDYYWADHFFALGKNSETLLAQFSARFPALKGCKVEVRSFAAHSAVFTVSGNEPACRR